MSKKKADQSTDSTTPPQLQFKQYQIPVAAKERAQSSSEGPVDIEYYDVLYTKHIRQKSKSWEDGFLEHHLKTQRVSATQLICIQLVLYSREAKNSQVDSKFFRVIPDLSAGSQFQMNKFLVDVEVRLNTLDKPSAKGARAKLQCKKIQARRTAQL